MQFSQDLTNRIWFAGPTGLSMYNGNKIRVFDKQSGIKCQGLRTIEILDDIVWLGTDLGLESINTDGSPTNFILVERMDLWSGTKNHRM